jgi:hypothetical protein
VDWSGPVGPFANTTKKSTENPRVQQHDQKGLVSDPVASLAVTFYQAAIYATPAILMLIELTANSLSNNGSK